MFARLKAWAIRKRAERQAAERRSRAFVAHREAVRRGDTRAAHWTRKALYRATHEKLRLEVQGSSRGLADRSAVSS